MTHYLFPDEKITLPPLDWSAVSLEDLSANHGCRGDEHAFSPGPPDGVERRILCDCGKLSATVLRSLTEDSIWDISDAL